MSGYDAVSANANKLNRELLRWIQSLDLAYSIKNVKRDFSNGFLAAEIISRYYDKEISMHSYDNGSGSKVKRDNWDQLLKLFQKIPDLDPLANKSGIDAVIYCQNGAAVELITRLYECLTKRTIMNNPRGPDIEPSASIGTPTEIVRYQNLAGPISPSYAKLNGTAVLRERARNPDIAGMTDEGEIHKRLQQAQVQYQERLHLERLSNKKSEWDRLAIVADFKSSRATRETLAKSNAKITTVLDAAARIKESQRALQDPTNTCTEAAASDVIAKSVGSTLQSGPKYIEKYNITSLCATATEELNAFITSRHPNYSSKLGTSDSSHLTSIFEFVYDENYSLAQKCAIILDVAAEKSILLAETFLYSPTTFWITFNYLYPSLIQSAESNTLRHAVKEFFLSVGIICVQLDPSTAAGLAFEYIMTKISVGSRLPASTKKDQLQILFTYIAHSPIAHIQAIKRLRDSIALKDLEHFVHLLAILIHFETELNGALADLYHYYCCTGLESKCCKLRAACLSMLDPLLEYNAILVGRMVPFLETISSLSDHGAYTLWWEVRAQLIRVSSLFLQKILCSDVFTENAEERDELLEGLVTIIDRELQPQSQLPVKQLGLYYVSPLLPLLQELVPLYVDVLKSINAEILAPLLRCFVGFDGTLEADKAMLLALPGYTGFDYELRPLPPVWDSNAIAKQLYYEWTSDTDEVLGKDITLAESLVLHACFEQLSIQEVMSGSVPNLYDQIKSYLLLGLLKKPTCTSTTDIMRIVLGCCNSSSLFIIQSMFTHTEFITMAVQIVSLGAHDIRQQALAEFMRNAVKYPVLESSEINPIVQKCIETIASFSDPSEFKSSEIYKLYTGQV